MPMLPNAVAKYRAFAPVGLRDLDMPIKIGFGEIEVSSPSASQVDFQAEYGPELLRHLQIEFNQVVQTVTDTDGHEMTAPDPWRIAAGHFRLDEAQTPRNRHQPAVAKPQAAATA